MLDRKTMIEELMQYMYAMRKKLMVKHHEGSPAEITPAQGFVLRFVAHHEAVNIKTIAQALQISSSATTQLVDGLVEKDYLLREHDTHDKRVIILSLSAKAKKQLKAFKNKHVKKLTEAFSALTDKELAQFMALNKKLMEAISEK